MLRDSDTGRGDDQRRARRNVEGIRPVTSGPARIEHIVVPLRHLDGMRAHGTRQADDLDRPLAFHREAYQESGNVRRRGPPVHHLAHRGGGLVGRQVLMPRQFFDEILKHTNSVRPFDEAQGRPEALEGRLKPDTTVISVVAFVQKVPEDVLPLSGEDRFRMKLDTVHRPGLVTKAHDVRVLAGPRGDFELRGQTFLRNDQ